MHKNIDEGFVGSCAYPENGLRANKRHEPLREFMIERAILGFVRGVWRAGVAAYMSPRGARCNPSTSRGRRVGRSRIQGRSLCRPWNAQMSPVVASWYR